MEQALRPYAISGVALLGASMIAVTPMVKLPALPELQWSAVQLSAAEADAFALVINVLDPGAFTNAFLQRLPMPSVPSPYPLITSSIHSGRPI